MREQVASRVAIVLAGSAAVTPLVLALAIHTATRRRIVSLPEAPVVPTLLVLGAEVLADGRPSRFLQARLDVALALYERGGVERIILSGDGTSRFYDEPAGMRTYLGDKGVPEAVLVTDPLGLDTYASCERARVQWGADRVIVVSQRYHLPRALAICRMLGLDAWGVGDVTARSSPRTWAHGARREVAANLKLVWDVVSRRPWLVGGSRRA
ncbi:MAG: ElyC/SanA/YdcF family protein [Propionicimonas sp.]